VLIPASNVKHLMLRDEVVRACAEGKFAIYPVEHVDQAIELLTGVAAGAPDEKGLIPEGTVNAQVAIQLAQMSALRRAYVIAGHKRAGRKNPARKKRKLVR
jgi:predicted ATP-dependent protease